MNLWKLKLSKFSTTKLAAIVLSIWLGIHFTLPIEYWVMTFFMYVGITVDLGKKD
jgi:hypothetical protein